jgi:hypothetical protein
MAVLCLAIPLMASACVTITPAKVAALPTPEETLGAPTARPTDTPAVSPSIDPTAPSTDAPPSGKPGKTPKPPKSPRPSTEPTADPSQGPIGNTGDPACFDDAYTLEGFSWEEPFKWRYNSPSTPLGFDADAVQAVLQRGFDNMVNENNDCGRLDAIDVEVIYMGTTPATPCSQIGDGVNVVGWGKMSDSLSEDTIAYTCPYHFTSTGKIAEADIVISTDINWALTADDCLFEELLEPTITHEVGHALGLGHVSERSHPDLTMSTRSNGECSNEESTLGLGDMLGLESLYPSSD